ncbi:DUF1223 domain-containing protein [Blastopirellula sp. J2-11]|uniref:DUF1223 domain-containing protein n=1 Tax=Blastopirellula sp. J2-11 TaxID=2943192 RepID=UPI0021C5A561|nr:DUF1223 domain-containing protein [Blastopirellula sp. J2-11]UUO07224.1 DUF1223 domain-containing protein [Blastopirellula sp. J2-11]
MTPLQISRRMALRMAAGLTIGFSPSLDAPLRGEEETTAQAATSGFALIELFTSEGCNSCPSADQNLARVNLIAQQQKLPIYTLSFHVDYWNYLGWEDPFSDAAFSQRQRIYAQAFNADRVYTPQMIVNGRVEFVGSNQATTDRAIDAGLRSQPITQLKVNVTSQANMAQVTWRGTDLAEHDSLQLALVQKRASRQVDAGENKGRTLSHVNVVRKLQMIQSPAAVGQAKLELPPQVDPADYHLTALVQSRTDQKIRFAAQAEFAAS